MSVTKYRQIANLIAKRIDQSFYRVGDKLPPHRVLAKQLNTTPVTVAKAYRYLAQQGRISSHVGKGSFVLGESPLEKIITPKSEYQEYNFSILQPCLEANLSVLSRLFSDLQKNISQTLVGYVEHSGLPRHKSIFSDWLNQMGLLHADSKQIVLTNGAQHGLALAIEMLSEPGDTVLVEQQSYPGIFAICEQLGRQVYGVEMDPSGMCPDHLQYVIDRHEPKLVIVVPSYQNPTGITMPTSRRKEVAEVIEQNHLWLVEDDIYAFLNSVTIPAISSYIPDRSIYISSMSKLLSPALRSGLLYAPQELVARFEAKVRATIWLSSPLMHEVAAQAISSNEIVKLIRNQKRIAKQRQEVASKILKMEMFGDGYHIWLPIDSRVEVEEFVTQARNVGIIVSSGRYFDSPNFASHHIRLSLMAIDEDEKFEQGLVKLSVLLEQQTDERKFLL
ncbi:aminotransferase-like domain-containing protein [Vibrio sp. WJH972]